MFEKIIHPQFQRSEGWGSMEVNEILHREEFLKHVDEVIQSHTLNDHSLVCLSIQNSHLFYDWYGEKGAERLLKTIVFALQKYSKDHPCTYGWFVNVNFYVFIEKKYFVPKELHKVVQNAVYNMNGIAPFRILMGIYNVANNTVLNADNMCNKAKIANITAGRNDENIHIFQDQILSFLKEKVAYEGDIQKAMDEKEFIFYLMPKCNSINDKIIGAEALIRWNNPKLGIIPPNVFMPTLESESIIAKLDYYIWDAVCATLQKWKNEGQKIVSLSINVSAVDIQTIDVAKTIIDLIDKYEIDPRWLHIEITESAVAKNTDYVVDMINRLHDKGILVEMDDFGSGFSSLNMLKEIPVDSIKLDMRMMKFNESNESKAKNIAKSVIQMAHSLNLPIVVEGVENKQQIQFLHSLDCIYVQGFYYYKPMDLESFEELIVHNQAQDCYDLHEDYKKWIHHEMDFSMANMDFNELVQAFNIFVDYSTACGMLNLESGQYQIIKANKNLKNSAGDKIDWEAYVQQLIDINIIHENTHAIFKQKTNLEWLKKRLYYNNKPEVFRAYKNLNGVYKWVLIKLIPARNCSPSNPYCVLEETEYIKIDPDEGMSDYYYTIDTLTKTFNRNKYAIDIDSFQYAWMRKLVVSYVDVVGLHEINNHLGHQRGDEMLATIAMEAQRVFVQSLVYRIGGDEFVILSPDVDQSDVEKKMKEFQDALKENNYYISVGIAETSDLNKIKETINVAEMRMREEKQNFYKMDENHRQERSLNQQLENIIIQNDQMMAIFDSIKEKYEGFFISNMETEEIVPVFASDEIKEMIHKNGGNTYRSICYFIHNSISEDSLDPVRKYLDPSYLSLYLSKNPRLDVQYKRKDGKHVALTILKNIRKNNEYIWIFKKAD